MQLEGTSAYQRGLLKGQTPKTATLVKRKDGSYYLNIQLESQPPQIETADKVLGCDWYRRLKSITKSLPSKTLQASANVAINCLEPR